MPLLNPFTVFGTVFLILTLIRGSRMKTTVDNPNCGEEVRNVKLNKILFPTLLSIDIIIILTGIIIYFSSN